MISQNKTQPTSSSTDEYLQTIESEARKNDAYKLAAIMKEVTDTEPQMWGTSIVGYGKHHYKYETGREGDTVAVGFSSRKAAFTIYGLFHYEENEENIELAQRLGTHTHGKGCVYIKSLDVINLEILKQMISNAYSARND